VALVASAGGFTALVTVLSALPTGFPAALVVLQHLSPNRPSRLGELLARRCHLPVTDAADGARLQGGVVTVAVPGKHLTVTPERTVALTTSPPVHSSRPSADVLLCSIAACGARAIAVVLSGYGADGAEGAAAVHRRGGTVIAQDQASAEAWGMPGAAVATGTVDRVLSAREIAAALAGPVLADAVDGPGGDLRSEAVARLDHEAPPDGLWLLAPDLP
jgi:two-component system chemotaxis response regulator CheB